MVPMANQIIDFVFQRGEKRGRLRPVSRNDWAIIVGWWNNSEVRRLFDVHFVDQTFSDAEKWFSKSESGEEEKPPRSFVIEVDDQGKWAPVGTAEFYGERPSHGTAEFGFMIGDKKWWGQGIGTETAKRLVKYGFEQLGYKRIGAVSAAYNTRSTNALQKAGFQIEGIRKSYVLRDGQYHDQTMMSVIRPD
jgi:RimJ/RimL family protein N-acetyltransferase